LVDLAVNHGFWQKLVWDIYYQHLVCYFSFKKETKTDLYLLYRQKVPKSSQLTQKS